MRFLLRPLRWRVNWSRNFSESNAMLTSAVCRGVFCFFFWRIFSMFFLTSLLGHIRIGVWNFQEQQGVSQGSSSNGDKVFGWLFKLPTHIHINTASPHTHTYPQPHFSRLPFNCSEILLDWHFPHQERRVQPIEILTINYSASTSLSHSFSSNKVGLEIEGHSSTPNAVYFGLHLSIYSSIHLISSLPQVWMIFFFFLHLCLYEYVLSPLHHAFLMSSPICMTQWEEQRWNWTTL